MSEREAKAALDRFATAHIATRSQRPTIATLWDKWMKDREEDGYNNAIYMANWASLEPFFGYRDPLKINKSVCREYARMRFDAGRAPATVWTELARFRHCLRWAVGERLIEFMPPTWLPSKGTGRSRVLTPDEAKRLLAGAAKGDPHVFLFVVLCLTTGARHMAILDLTWDRIDFVRGTIAYDENLPPDPMNKSWRKGRATVAMTAAARVALERAFAGRQTKYVIEHGGKRLKSVRDGFRNATQRAGLGRWVNNEWETDVTPHVLRHTVNTWMKDRGIGPEKRAQMLGHADIETNKRSYTHEGDVPTYLGEAARVIDLQLGDLSQVAEASKNDPQTA